MSVVIAKLVALVVRKEAFNALFTKIRRSIQTISGTNGRVGNFAAAFVSVELVLSIATLDVANDKTTARAVVSIVCECFHSKHTPSHLVLRVTNAKRSNESGPSRFHLSEFLSGESF